MSGAASDACRVFIVGCGDLGQRVAALEQADGHSVAGMARSPKTEDALTARGMVPVWADLDDPASLHGLPIAGRILYYFAPPPSFGLSDPRLDALLESLAPARRPERLVYISTSGVYGDCQGAWIDESRPLNPRNGRAQRRVAAEGLLRKWAETSGIPYIILRVPGIYGPGRLPVQRLRAGLPVVREEEAPFSNRIHADDLAAVCVAAARRGKPGRAYNVSDGHPTTLTDYFFRVADHLGLPRPPAVSLEEARSLLSPSMLSFLEESKRLDNCKMISELGVRLRLPDLTRGLPASL